MTWEAAQALFAIAAPVALVITIIVFDQIWSRRR